MIEHNGYTFTCAMDTYPSTHAKFVIKAHTERTAIAHAREADWDILRVRAVAGVPKEKIARTVRLAFCPGCAHRFGVCYR